MGGSRGVNKKGLAEYYYYCRCKPVGSGSKQNLSIRQELGFCEVYSGGQFLLRQHLQGRGLSLSVDHLPSWSGVGPGGFRGKIL